MSRHGWLACCLVVFGVAAQTVPPRVLDPQQKVGGITQSEYAELWWQWAMRLPDGVRAYQDPSGAQCGMNQSGPVWFLAGTEGTMRVNRRCDVPSGRFIFFPVIGMNVHARPGKPIDCRTAMARARDNNDKLVEASVMLDGQAIQRIGLHRIRSAHCFDAYAKAKYLEHHEAYVPAASDGYWIMLGPLSDGIHHLVVHARYDNAGKPLGDLEQSFEYELHVAPDNQPSSRPSLPPAPEPPLSREGLIST
jgi:hypothetical protein